MSSITSDLDSSLVGDCTNTKTKEVHEVTHTWTIDNFDLSGANGDKLTSSTFSAPTNDEIVWQLQLSPNGENIAKDTISLYLRFQPGTKVQTVFANLISSILTDKGEKKLLRRIEGLKFDVNHHASWGWKNFCSKDLHFKNMLSDKKLTIQCEVVFSTVCNALIKETSIRSNVHNHESYLYKNVASLFENPLLTDIVISTKGKEFRVHKVLLAACSTVFAAMFQHDTKENQLNRIDIEDMDEEILGEMIRFIYTGRCEKLGELAGGLLVAADKYDLDPLKMMCSKELCENLSIENVVQNLILADLHNVNELKSGVMKFISSKSTEVFATEDWKRVLLNPRLIDGVCRALVRQ